MDEEDPEVKLQSKASVLSYGAVLCIDSHDLWQRGFPKEVPTIEVSLNDDIDFCDFTGQCFKVTAQDGAYILSTSGTTGTPKLIEISHQSLFHFVESFDKEAPLLSSSGSGTSVCPFNFDVSMWEIFSCLSYGHTLHILPIYQTGQSLARYFSDHSIQSAYVPPTILEEFIERYNLDGSSPLERVLIGVEPIKQKTIAKLKEAEENK